MGSEGLDSQTGPDRNAVAAPRDIINREVEVLDMRFSQHCQIGARHDRTQERAGATAAGTATLIHLKIGIAEVVSTIELVDLRYAAGLSSISPGIKNFEINPTFLDRKLSTNAMKLITTVLVVFRLFEDRQYIIPGPAAVAELRPVVVVAFLASHIDHGVNRTTAAQAFAAGIVDTAVVQTGIWLDFIAPVGARVIDGKKVARRDVDPEVVILFAGFQ